ncbi:MAG: hypothetical protein EHM57_05930 [Actinobacteria bacterium]|nr:MAG: hypothetical protein EHM57_05930 [Actinomycetota bacterium]
MTADETIGESGEDAARYAGAFTRCSRCSMETRRSEMEVHLAHAHDIGPMTNKKPRGDKDGRGFRRSSSNDR